MVIVDINYVSKNVQIGLCIFIVNTNTWKVKSYRKSLISETQKPLKWNLCSCCSAAIIFHFSRFSKGLNKWLKHDVNSSEMQNGNNFRAKTPYHVSDSLIPSLYFERKTRYKWLKLWKSMLIEKSQLYKSCGVRYSN